jgi:hypothetical protein
MVFEMLSVLLVDERLVKSAKEIGLWSTFPSICYILESFIGVYIESTCNSKLF